MNTLNDKDILEALAATHEAIESDPIHRSQFFHFPAEAGMSCELLRPDCRSIANWRRPPSEYHKFPMYACDVCVERLRK